MVALPDAATRVTRKSVPTGWLRPSLEPTACPDPVAHEVGGAKSDHEARDGDNEFDHRNSAIGSLIADPGPRQQRPLTASWCPWRHRDTQTPRQTGGYVTSGTPTGPQNPPSSWPRGVAPESLEKSSALIVPALYTPAAPKITVSRKQREL